MVRQHPSPGWTGQGTSNCRGLVACDDGYVQRVETLGACCSAIGDVRFRPVFHGLMIRSHSPQLAVLEGKYGYERLRSRCGPSCHGWPWFATQRHRRRCCSLWPSVAARGAPWLRLIGCCNRLTGNSMCGHLCFPAGFLSCVNPLCASMNGMERRVCVVVALLRPSAGWIMGFSRSVDLRLPSSEADSLCQARRDALGGLTAVATLAHEL
jgi:hypothetical protein